jgi:hypothetical protein
MDSNVIHTKGVSLMRYFTFLVIRWYLVFLDAGSFGRIALQVTVGSRVLLYKLTITQLANKFPAFKTEVVYNNISTYKDDCLLRCYTMYSCRHWLTFQVLTASSKPLKHWSTSMRLHGATQNTVIFILAAMREYYTAKTLVHSPMPYTIHATNATYLLLNLELLI